MSNPATQARPVVVVVTGQPGAGKTQVADLVHTVLGRRGGAARLGRALYESAHRHYAGALAADVRTTGVLVRPAPGRQTAVEIRERRTQRAGLAGPSAAGRPAAVGGLPVFRGPPTALRSQRLVHRFHRQGQVPSAHW
ncbi:zeta toxin family protein [Streptomyces acidicola]|uniref:zeta toxin family protein n=1 Tax=Streptomyces acidicola TaxID=2596892 RepID=UPI00342D8A86